MFEKIEDLVKSNISIINDRDKEKIESLKKHFSNFFNEEDQFNIQEFNLFLNKYNLLKNDDFGYYLNWKGKKEAAFLANSNSLSLSLSLKHNTLKPDIENSLDFDNAKDILIVGDNLEVLKIIEGTYTNKVDIIYIDPPYNTGKDFIYDDKFKSSNDEYLDNAYDEDNNIKSTAFFENKKSGKYHTNWLNMMYPRLIKAKNLLNEKGVIFISIDDNEQANLKLICDEIFGEDNFISNFIWHSKNKPSGNTISYNKIDIVSEYILCYQKNIKKNIFNIKINNEEDLKQKKYILKDIYFEKRGFYKLTPLWRSNSGNSFQYQKSLDYPIEAPDGSIIKIWQNENKINKDCYTWSENLFYIGKQLGFIEFVKNEKNDRWNVFRKIYEKSWLNPKLKKEEEKLSGNAYKNIINDIKQDSGTNEYRHLNIKTHFTSPKPSNLIKFLINLIDNKDALVLDFFAGSGTTGHAVWDLNKEDNGNRKFILVQAEEEIENGEFKYISEITRERLKRANEKFNYNKSFKSFYVDKSNIFHWDNNINNLEENLKLFENKKIENDNEINLLYEILLFLKIDLDTKIYKNITVNNNILFFNETKNFVFAYTKKDYSNLDSDILNEEFLNLNNAVMTIIVLDEKFNDVAKINFSNSIKQFKNNYEENIEIKVYSF